VLVNGLEPITAVIQHKAISNYMEARTMPFRVKTPNELVGLQSGDVVKFRCGEIVAAIPVNSDTPKSAKVNAEGSRFLFGKC
jgi:hypothetical protein